MWTGFYAGLTPAVIGITPQMGLNFALYETFKLLVTGDADETSSQRSDSSAKKKDSLFKSTVLKGFCGGAAGGISKLIVYPLVHPPEVTHLISLRNSQYHATYV